MTSFPNSASIFLYLLCPVSAHGGVVKPIGALAEAKIAQAQQWMPSEDELNSIFRTSLFHNVMSRLFLFKKLSYCV